MRIVKGDAVVNDGLLETRQFRSRRPVLDFFRVVQIFENFLRGADRLLKDVVNAGEPLHGLVHHEQRDDETRELPGREHPGLDLCACVDQQADDRDRAEHFDQGRRDGLLPHVA